MEDGYASFRVLGHSVGLPGLSLMAAFAFWAWRDLEPFLFGGLTLRTIRRYGTHRAEGGVAGHRCGGFSCYFVVTRSLLGIGYMSLRMKNSRRFLSRPIRNARSCALKPRAVPSCHVLPFPFPFLSQSHPLPIMAPPFFPSITRSQPPLPDLASPQHPLSTSTPSQSPRPLNRPRLASSAPPVSPSR